MGDSAAQAPSQLGEGIAMVGIVCLGLENRVADFIDDYWSRQYSF